MRLPWKCYDNYNFLSEEIVKRSGKDGMDLNWLKYPCIEIYKSINNINSSLEKQIFQRREAN